MKGENSVKVFGPDLESNEKNADAIVDVMGKVPGVKDLGTFQSLGQPNIKITPDARRVRALRPEHGRRRRGRSRRPSAGRRVTQVYEGEKRFDLTVRWKPQYRMSLEAIREITVSTPDGAQVPLGQLADIQIVEGPAIIYREDGVRYSPVKFSVRGRDLASTIAEAQASIERDPAMRQGAGLGEAVPALRHAPRVGGRDQRAARGRGAARDHHPAHAPAHRVPRLQRRQELGRHAHRPHEHPGRVHGRGAGAPRHAA